MSKHESVCDRGTFICRIDGRAGYLRLWDDRLELIRSGRRGPQVLGPDVFPLHLVTRVGTGKPGRVFTAVQLVLAGAYLELKMPSIDAPRVADLIALLVSEAPVVEDVPSYAAPEPLMVEPMMVEPLMVEPVMVEPVMVESLPAEFVMPDFSMTVEMPEWEPLADPAGLSIPKVEMPVWTPLPETDQPDTELPEMVLSQIVLDELTPEPVPVASTEPVLEIEPLPDGSVLAAAAALAELESMLGDIPMPTGDVVLDDNEFVHEARDILAPTAPVADEADGASIPAQPSEAVLTLAAAALLGGARSAAPPVPEPTPEPAPKPERPADLPEDMERRLGRLEVLLDSGIMTEADFDAAVAEIYEAASQTA